MRIEELHFRLLIVVIADTGVELVAPLTQLDDEPPSVANRTLLSHTSVLDDDPPPTEPLSGGAAAAAAESNSRNFNLFPETSWSTRRGGRLKFPGRSPSPANQFFL